MPLLEVREVGKRFEGRDRAVDALEGASMSVEEGEFVTILGPSGCGKSTLLHMIGGFEHPTSGSITLRGREIDQPGRERGMVFQQATLYPWWTVERNVAWPLLVDGASKAAARERSRELLELVGLSGFGKSHPGELSGGMQQRAALARTLALEPEVLLMDEPFGALDAQTRELMQEELERIWQATSATVVFVTHDIYEAIFLGDRVLVMSARPGRFVEDTAVELPRPRDPELKNSREMHDQHTHLWQLIREVSLKAAPEGDGARG